MSRRTIIIVILLALISLGVIIAGQVFWVRKAYGIQERQFNEHVMFALTAVVDEILVMNNDSSVTEPVLQKESNFFVANINDTPSPYLLETLLKEQFERYNLKEDFEYGIYDCFTDSIVFGSRVNFDTLDNEVRAEATQIKAKFEPDGHYFGVLFPNKTATILKQLDFWMYSSFVIFLIIIFFSYTIFVILKHKRLSEVKSDFINNMTHELKTPISTISLSAEALSNPNIVYQPERFKQYISIIKNENQRLRSQVDKVLQIATLTPKKVSVKMEEIDLHEIILKATETFSVNVAEDGGELSTKLNATRSIINGDLVHITNVIYNLLDNARKYTEVEPIISIESYNDKDRIVVKVKDNGVGINQSHLGMIFDKFYRVPTGNLHNVKGFGLGLFYVNTIMKAHKAKISVESKVGKGSTFTLEFKLA
jgi:two-component system, OmpR family, phosphate regulon sensor histidine kinase PhoR